MSLISNIQLSEDSIFFDLNNSNKEIKISLANAIRRIILSDIYTYIIDYHKIIFFENTSMLNDEFLKHRISLVPIVSDLEDINYDNIIITCKKMNANENIESIYVKDFICRDVTNDKVIDNNLLFKYPNILLGKLKTNQNISFEAKLLRDNPEKGGAEHCPVSICLYTFKIDENEANSIKSTLSTSEKIRFDTLDKQRVYEKNSSGEPNVYSFKIESIGFYSPLKILFFGLDALIERLNNISIEINNPNSKKVTILDNYENPDIYQFLIDNENETIGNLLSSYLTYDPNVFFVGYVIEHPLKKNILLRLKLIENNSEENNIIYINKYIKYLIDIINKIKSEFM